MTSIRTFLVVSGIAVAVAGVAPASAAVLTTGPIWGSDASAGVLHVCQVVNTGTTPLSATSKVEILDYSGAVQFSGSLSGLPPNATTAIGGSLTLDTFAWCRVTVPSAKKVRAKISTYFYDGTRNVDLSTDVAR